MDGSVRITGKGGSSMGSATAASHPGRKGRQVMGRIIKHAELDERLDRLARDPARYDERARALIREYDRADARLEITDPSSYRRPMHPGREGRVPLHQQLRADIDSIILLDRDDEVRLARRVEFARWRFERALKQKKLSKEGLLGSSSGAASMAFGPLAESGALPRDVSRRWIELHALRTELVERNLYLVLINVERYSHTTASQSDLIQEGSAALFRAVDGFDWRRGLLFRTYAVHWLNQAFRSHLYNFGNTVRVPVYLQKALKHINDAKARLGGAASVDEIAQVTEMAEALVSSALAAARSSRSLDRTLDDEDDGGRLRDLLQDDVSDPYDPAIEEFSLESSLRQAMTDLSDRERFVLEQRFGINTDREHTLAEVAEALGVSLERVRQIQVRALGKLRSAKLRRVVEPFLN
jgi:RNA polymerase sigma factor (sigma-70 family)